MFQTSFLSPLPAYAQADEIAREVLATLVLTFQSSLYSIAGKTYLSAVAT